LVLHNRHGFSVDYNAASVILTEQLHARFVDAPRDPKVGAKALESSTVDRASSKVKRKDDRAMVNSAVMDSASMMATDKRMGGEEMASKYVEGMWNLNLKTENQFASDRYCLDIRQPTTTRFIYCYSNDGGSPTFACY
jgi:hypothetical protein